VRQAHGKLTLLVSSVALAAVVGAGSAMAQAADRQESGATAAPPPSKGLWQGAKDIWWQNSDKPLPQIKQIPDAEKAPALQNLEPSRPGYRPTVTKFSQEFYQYIMAKAGRGEPISQSESIMIRYMITTRSWPEAPQIDANDKAAGKWIALHDTIVANAMEGLRSSGGKLDYDNERPKLVEQFRNYYHSIPEDQRNWVARRMMDYYNSLGYDMRSDQVKEVERQREELRQRKEKEAQERERRRLELEAANKKAQEQAAKDKAWFDKIAAEERLRDKINQSKQPPTTETQSPTRPKNWKDLTTQEKHDALKNNEPDAWAQVSAALNNGDPVSVLQWLGKTTSDKSADSTQSAMGLNQANQQVAAASTSGDQQAVDANNAKDQAGAEAQNTRSQSSAQSAADQQKNSWNTVMGDALIQSIAAGGAALGTTVGASAAANAGASLFTSGKRHGTGTTADKPEDAQGPAVTGQDAKDNSAPTTATDGNRAPTGDNMGAAPPVRTPTTTASGPTTSSTAVPPPTPNCPKCGKPMTPIVVPKDPSKVDDYRWACLNCGIKDYRPPPTATTAKTPPVPVKTTPPAVTATPPPKPPAPAAPKGWKCPVCGSYDTKYIGVYYADGTDMYHCNGCGGTVHNVSN